MYDKHIISPLVEEKQRVKEWQRRENMGHMGQVGLIGLFAGQDGFKMW